MQVDRHIRLLDQAIKEQEAAMSLSLPGSRPAPILPDLVVSRWGRPSRATLSPISDEPEELDFMDGPNPDADSGGAATGDTGNVRAQRGGNRKGRVGRGKPRKAEGEATEGLKSLRITLPPAQTAMPSAGADPAERYCYCDGISFGEVRLPVQSIFRGLLSIIW